MLAYRINTRTQGHVSPRWSSAGATTIDPYDDIPNKLPVIYRTQNLGTSVACAGFSLGLLVILQLITTQAGWLIATAVISFVIFAKPLYFERLPSNLSVSLSLIVFGFRSRALMSKPLEHTFGPLFQVSGTELALITVSRTTRCGVHMNLM